MSALLEYNQVNLLLDLTSDYILITDHEGIILQASKSIYIRLGYSQTEIINKHISILYQETERNTATTYFQEFVNNKREISTLPLIDKQENLHSVITHSKPIDSTEKSKFLSVSTPLATVKDFEKKFYQFFKTNQTLMAISDHETGAFIDVNEAFATTIKMSREQIIGRSAIDLKFLTQEQRNELIDIFNKQGYIKNYKLEITTPHGKLYGTFSADIVEWNERKAHINTFINETEQVLTSNALKQSNKRYHDLVELLPEMICEVDLNGNILYANTFALETLGYSPIDLENGLHFKQIFASQDIEKLTNQFTTIKDKDAKIPSEYKAQTKDGRRFDSLVYSSPIIENGVCIGIRSVLLDISSQKQAAEKLRQSEERLELALHCVDQGLWNWNIQTGEVYFSDRWASMLGYEATELKPHISTWEEIVHPQDLPKVQEALNKHISGLSLIYRTEHRVKTKRGDWLWILDTGRVVEWDSMRRPVRAVGTQINIDEEKKAKLFLQNHVEQQEIVSKILFNINNPIDFDTKIEQTLEYAGQYVGASRAYIMEYDLGGDSSSNTHEWCNPEIHSMKNALQNIPHFMFPSWQTLFNTDGKIICSDIKNLPHDLQHFFYLQFTKSIIAYPLVVADYMSGYLCFNFNNTNSFIKNEPELLRTITEIISNAYERRNVERWLRTAKTEADNANKAKSEFLANMSHEIRTPLNAVLGISEALANRTKDEFLKNKLQTINSSGKTLLSLINDILDLSKIEAGRIEITPTPTSLSMLVKEVSNIFTHKAHEKDIELSHHITSTVPSLVELDETRIRQLLFNLIGNAVKFTDIGQVHIHIDAISNAKNSYTIIITVSDTGIGIPLEQQKIIFEAFRQQSGQDNRKYGGTGLGLAITKKIVELMRGVLELESSPNKGSTFTVTLPNVPIAQHHNVITTPTSSFDSVIFSNAVVLLIDDIPINIETIELLSQSSNISIVGISSSKKALEWLEDNTPQLILCDIRMPELDGWELSKIIKKTDKLKNIPIVAYTASATLSEQLQISLHFDGMLLKPASQSSLFEIFEQFLPYSEKQDEQQKAKELNIDDIKIENPDFISNLRALCSQTEILDLEYIDITQTEIFAKQLKNIIIKHNIETLIPFANQLSLHCETFDLEHIETAKRTLKSIISND